MSVKVALINPGKDRQYAVQEPLSLGFIASYLEKHGVQVKIIDELAGQKVISSIVRYRPDFVGITATTPIISEAYKIAQAVKRMGICTVIGGVHASIFPDEALLYADLVVVGEGETAMLDIIKDNIQSGVVKRPYIKNIDEIPAPARHLMRMDFYMRSKERLPHTYLYFVPPHTKVAAVLTSRGCPYDCIFCHNTWKNMPYRFNSPERVVSEIRELSGIYGVKAVFFIEDNFFVNKKRVIDICFLLREQGLSIIWGANARVDNIDLEILKVAKGAGCRQITFGFESGSQRILDILNKKTTVEQNKRAIELCNQAGIIPQGTVMIGNPQETIDDVRATQQFVKDCDIRSLGVCITTPYPGTKLWEWCKRRRAIPQKINWANFNYSKVVIPVSDALSVAQIKKLRGETLNILVQKYSLGFFQKVTNVLRRFIAIVGMRRVCVY
ncbi:MAG: radical SAM protein [Candidatus Omnitrophota bacterium]